MVNLLSNAVKFAPTGSRVTIEATSRAGSIEVRVADRGQGIRTEDLPKLFQKFQQVDDSAARNKGGTGLGLAIVRGLIEQHGGTIRVESEPGRGSTFIFTVPVADAAAPAAPPRPAGRASAREPNGAVVLVVDDDDDFRDVMRRQLERAGFRVLQAPGGEAALEILRESKVDVITVDLLMSGMDGWTLMRRLSEDPALCHLPVIVISAIADQAGDVVRDISVLSKTLDPDDVVREITALLPAPSACVLIAEDDDDLRELLAHALRKRGFTTEEARDGREALAKLDAGGIALLVLDLGMPHVDGLQVLQHLQASPGKANVPVLVISGMGEDEFRVMNLGARRYLSKPLDVGEVARLAQSLAAREAPAAPNPADRR